MLAHPALAPYCATYAGLPRYSFPVPQSAQASTPEELEKLFEPPLLAHLTGVATRVLATAVDAGATAVAWMLGQPPFEQGQTAPAITSLPSDGPSEMETSGEADDVPVVALDAADRDAPPQTPGRVARRLTSVFLDTTYCRPQHSFPPQEDVIAFVRCTRVWDQPVRRTSGRGDEGSTDADLPPPPRGAPRSSMVGQALRFTA